MVYNTRFRSRILCGCGRATGWHADIMATREEWERADKGRGSNGGKAYIRDAK